MGDSLIKSRMDLGVRRGAARRCVSVGQGCAPAAPARKGPGKVLELGPGGDGCGLRAGPPHDRADGLLLTPQGRGRGRKIYYPTAILLSVCSPL